MEKNTDRIPEDATELERWAASSWGISKMEVSYEMTGADTAVTKVILTPFRAGGDASAKSRKISDTDFRRLFKLELDHVTVARPKQELTTKVKARVAYEQHHAKELAEYARLKALFG